MKVFITSLKYMAGFVIWWRHCMVECQEIKWRFLYLNSKSYFLRYYINFQAKKGMRYISDVAIDDVSLSPECFGLNIPPEELHCYNYWNPKECDTDKKEMHKDFVNKTCKWNVNPLCVKFASLRVTHYKMCKFPKKNFVLFQTFTCLHVMPKGGLGLHKTTAPRPTIIQRLRQK